jgi:glycosyltransferase involved in cell wall biosynthesis
MSNNHKKLLCIIGQLGNGGTERQLYLFLKYLDKSSYLPSVLVAGSSGGGWEERIKKMGVPVTFMGEAPAWKKLLIFKRKLRVFKADIIYSWSFFTNAFALVSGKTPFIGSLRQQYAEEKRNLGRVRRKVSFLPQTIVVNSNGIAGELAEAGIDNEKIKVVFNVFETEFSNDSNFKKKSTKIRKDFCAKYAIPEDRTIIAGVGRNSPTKDFPFFVETIKALKEKGISRIHAVIIGSGGKGVKNKITDLGLEECFTLTGDIKDAKMILPAADIFFLSSRQEGMPNVLLEAIDAGVVPLATDVGGVRDIFKYIPQNLSGKIILKKRDPEHAADLIAGLIADNKLQKLILEAAQKFLKDVAPEKIIKQYCSIITK